MGLLAATCSRCKNTKPLTREYFPPHNKKRSGFDSWCRACRNAYRKEYRTPPGVRPEEQPRVFEARALGCCIICGDIGDTVVDHDHRTGRVRGLLCQRCNMGLGHFRDDPELLELAAMYLRGECACGECKVSWGGRPDEPEYVPNMKDEKGRPTRKALSLRKWDC